MHHKNIAFIAYYREDTIYSFNALIAALETDKITKTLDIFYVINKKQLFYKVHEILDDYKRVVIGISFYSTQIWDIKEIVNTLRKRWGNKLFLIAGGGHPSGDPKGTLRIGFDIAFIGESEKSIIEVIKRLILDNDYSEVKGIAFFDKNGIFHKNKKDYYIDLNKYPPFPLENTRFGAIEIARGCPYNCYFCQTPFTMGNKVRYRSIKSISKYLKILKSENLIDIRYITPNAFSYKSIDGRHINLSKLEELLSTTKNIIGEEGKIFFGTFPSEVRPEHVNEEILSIIKKYTDNDNIIIGAQSGSDRILKLCNRGHSVQDVYDAVKTTVKFDLLPNVDFIFGLPGETEEDVGLTINFMRKIIKCGARIHAHSFIPFPKTPFSEKKRRKIDKRTRKFIKDMNFRGHLYGNWKKQEEIALKIEASYKKYHE